MKCFPLSALISVSVLILSCGQLETKPPKIDVKTATVGKIPANGSYQSYHTMYEYIDTMGNTVVIKNSFPKGELYTAPDGKKYVKAIFWTKFENNTGSPLELAINFSGDSYDFPGSGGSSIARSYKLMVPPDTMTLKKENLLNFGLTGIGALVGKSINRPTSLKRTINPNEACGVYVIRLAIMQKADSEVPRMKIKSGGVTRAGFRLNGQNLLYVLNGKGFAAGSINFKHLTLKNYHKVGI